MARPVSVAAVYRRRTLWRGFIPGILSLVLVVGNLTVGYAASPAAAPGPRLYFTQERVEGLQARMATQPEFAQAWTTVQSRADRLLRAELVTLAHAEGGSGQHGNYGTPSSQIREMGLTLGLAYQMTGDPRYAEKLRDAMLHFAQLRRWAGDAHHEPPWHSELNTARFCFGYAVGYDAIRTFLSEEERGTIRAAMMRLGIEPTLADWIMPETRIHALDSMGHNWWSVCVAMAGVAALAIVDEEPQAKAWVKQIRDAFPEWFLYQGNRLQNKSLNFDREGAFYESVSYANYALSEFLLFALAYRSRFPDADLQISPLLEKSGSFFIHTAYPAGDSLLSVNFGDSHLTANGAKTIQLLRAFGIQTPGDAWYLSRTSWGLDDPLTLVYQDYAPSQALPDVPLEQRYGDIGWVMLRTGWDADSTLLAVKSGVAWNHAHPDANSFILFHGGKPLLIDSGDCSYSRPEYTRYYRQSTAHNVILTDGAAELPESCGGPDRGTVTPGEVSQLMNLDGIRYVLADATGPTAWKFSRNYRHFLWIDEVILILDDVRTHEAGQLEWLLHYEGSAKEQGNELLIENGATSRAIVRPLFPPDPTLVWKKGLKDHDPDTEVDYLAFAPAEKAREMKWITAILPLEANQTGSAVKTELVEEPLCLGVRIHHGNEVTEVFFNLQADGRRMHRNSNLVVQGWETDAALFGFTRMADEPGSMASIRRAFVVCGSYVRKEGHILLDSLSKIDSVIAYGETALDVLVQGQPLIRCAFYSPAPLRQVSLNGQTVPAVWNEEAQTVHVRWAE